jgi:hypothetical protein
MSQEIGLQAALTYSNPAVPVVGVALSFALKKFNIAGSAFQEGIQSIPTTAGGTALSVSGLATLGFYFVINTDTVHYVELMDAVSGNKICKIPAGACAVGYFPTGCTAPAALANTAAVKIQYLFLEQ